MTWHEKIALMSTQNLTTFWTLKFHNFVPKLSLSLKYLQIIQHTMENVMQVTNFYSLHRGWDKWNNVKGCSLCTSFSCWVTNCVINYHIAGKFGGDNVWRIYFFRAFGKKVWQMNRLDCFSLVNYGWSTKRFPHQTFLLYSTSIQFMTVNYSYTS